MMDSVLLKNLKELVDLLSALGSTCTSFLRLSQIRDKILALPLEEQQHKMIELEHLAQDCRGLNEKLRVFRASLTGESLVNTSARKRLSSL
ncbi:MAG: hypothetical protein PHS79_05485 [Patescibacteria group bacterium]|nr:hypothetical protein [Patescibacteria group bacterium]